MTFSRNRQPLSIAPDRTRRRLNGWLLAAPWIGVGGLSSLPAVAAGFDLATLLALLAQNGNAQATFDERKFIRQLDTPVDSSGELAFSAPATLVMRTLKPRQESMRLDGQTITLERGRQQRTLQLAEHPEIAIYVEPMRAALAGDRVALERYYDPALSGDAAQWTLRLTPRADAQAAAATVAAIVLSGRQGQVRQVEVRLADGDYSVMNIEPAR